MFEPMTTSLGPTRPDRMTLWFVEDDRVGVDVRWGGPAGVRRATVARDQLRAAGHAATLSQDESGWIVRLGPIERTAVGQLVDGFLY